MLARLTTRPVGLTHSTFDDEYRRAYERDLARRQAEHLKRIEFGGRPWQPCQHDGCPECVGTGRKKDGTACVHMLSCPCPRCNPFSM